MADDEGNSATLYETQPGYYATDSLLGRPGHTYNLTVNVGAETFTASSTMPQAVALDTVYNLQARCLGYALNYREDPRSRQQQELLSFRFLCQWQSAGRKHRLQR
ncbi:MAG: hypothetical protein IPP17_02450 [Bacteroidetes bacterium]|nr:hypothetical protein [Bacteroidota bacterium]